MEATRPLGPRRTRPGRLGCAILLLVALLGHVVPARGGSFLESETLVHDGLTRWYDLYVPDGLAEAPVPLLLVLHGGTQSNDVLRAGAALRLRTLADTERFVLAFPNGTSSADGTSGPSGSFNWNDCRSDAGPATSTADDTGFIAALVDAISGRLPIDAERVYVAGASNGGMMAYRLALELSDRIAAVAASIANLPARSECVDAPAAPLSVLIMNGTADPIMPWAGGQVAGNRGLVLSAEATRDFWRERLGTSPTPRHVDFPDLDPDDAGTVSSDRYVGGREGSEVLFYTVTGGGHVPPGIAYPAGGAQNRDVEAFDEYWRFLSAQRRSGGGRRASGIQLSPDGRQVLVSKDVGDERWAIGYEAASGALTGNVFRADGEPVFLACTRAAPPAADPLTFTCAAADGCPGAPCDPASWTDLGAVELPASFLAAPAGG